MTLDTILNTAQPTLTTIGLAATGGAMGFFFGKKMESPFVGLGLGALAGIVAQTSIPAVAHYINNPHTLGGYLLGAAGTAVIGGAIGFFVGKKYNSITGNDNEHEFLDPMMGTLAGVIGAPIVYSALNYLSR